LRVWKIVTGEDQCGKKVFFAACRETGTVKKRSGDRDFQRGYPVRAQRFAFTNLYRTYYM
jgi:hypothetical protein